MSDEVLRVNRAGVIAAVEHASRPIAVGGGTDISGEGVWRHLHLEALPPPDERQGRLQELVQTFVELHDGDDGGGWPCNGKCGSVRALRAALAVAQVPAQEERLDAERLERAMRAAGFREVTTSTAFTASARAIAAEYRALGVESQEEGAEHEHYWVDAADDETGWHCTICGVTEYPEPPFGAESVGVEGAGRE